MQQGVVNASVDSLEVCKLQLAEQVATLQKPA